MHLLLATGESDPWHVAGGKQQVEGGRQKGPVAQQLEALVVVGGLAQQVLKGQPVEGHAHGAQTGVSQPHAQKVVKQALGAAGP